MTTCDVVSPIADPCSSLADRGQPREEIQECGALFQAEEQGHAEEFCEALSSVYVAMATLGAESEALTDDHRVTGFHAQVEPKIGVHGYLQRLQQFFRCSDCCHVVALIYIDRMINFHPHLRVTPRTIHRLLAVATVVGVKFLDDVFYSNVFCAKICGLRVQELNQLEARFLMLLRWNLVVKPGEYDAYLRQITSVSEALTSSRSASEFGAG